MRYLTLLRYWWQRQQHRRVCPHCQEKHQRAQLAREGRADGLGPATYPADAPATVKVYQHGAVAATWCYQVPIPAGLDVEQARHFAEYQVREGFVAPYDMHTSDPLDSRNDDIEVELA